MVDKIDLSIVIASIILGFGFLFRWCDPPTGQLTDFFCLGNVLMLSGTSFLLVSVSLCLLHEQRKA